MDKYAKRLQTRLSAKGFKFTKEQCRQALTATAANPDLPTDEEMVQAFNWLTTKDEPAGETESVAIEPVISTPTFDTPEESEAIAPPKAEEGQEDGFSPLQLQEEATTLSKPETSTNGIVHQEQGHLQEPSIGGITQAEITQAISQAIAQVGQQGNSEAVEILTSLANELSADIADTQEMVTALVTAYLGKRQHLLSSALGALNNLRSAQTESFQSGLDQNFFQGKNRSKQEFLCKVGAMFN